MSHPEISTFLIKNGNSVKIPANSEATICLKYLFLMSITAGLIASSTSKAIENLTVAANTRSMLSMA